MAVSAQERLQNEPAYKGEGGRRKCLQLRAGVTTRARRGFSHSSCLHQNWYSVSGTLRTVILGRGGKRNAYWENRNVIISHIKKSEIYMLMHQSPPFQMQCQTEGMNEGSAQLGRVQKSTALKLLFRLA